LTSQSLHLNGVYFSSIYKIQLLFNSIYTFMNIGSESNQFS